MKVVVASTFRDAVGYLDRHIQQAKDLLAALEARGDTCEFVWGENDSVDDTPARLRSVVGPITVLDVSTGAPYYRSWEDHDRRWRNVACFSNMILDQLPACDVLLWAESDLIWTAETAVALIDQALELGVVAAPMWLGDGRFYDTWTTYLDGERFTPPRNAGLVKVESAAGLIAVRGDLTHHRFPLDDACRGWTRDMGGVWLDSSLTAEHPL